MAKKKHIESPEEGPVQITEKTAETVAKALAGTELQVPAIGQQWTDKETGESRCITSIDEEVVSFGDGSSIEIGEFPNFYTPTPEVLPIQPIENADSVRVNITPRSYPVRTETRELAVHYTPEEIDQMSRDLSNTVLDINRIPAMKKALVLKQQDLADRILEETHEIPVRCGWEYECAGIDSDGHRIHSDTHKTLFRLDTGAVVETSMMTAEDRQLELNYAQHQQHPEAMAGEEALAEMAEAAHTSEEDQEAA